jgi:hypothetical protein
MPYMVSRGSPPPNGFSGLVVVPKIAGLNPTEAVGFFRRKNSQHAFLWRGIRAACPMSQICGMLKNPVIYVEVGITGEILAHNSVLH